MVEDKLLLVIVNASNLPRGRYKPNPYIEIIFRGN
jgi:hypothetical protein